MKYGRSLAVHIHSAVQKVIVSWPIDRSSSVILKKKVLKLMDRTVYIMREHWLLVQLESKPKI